MLETDRLVLRPLTRHDVDALVDLHADPLVNRFVPAFSRERALSRLAEIEEQWSERGHGLCAVELRATGEFIGRCGLNYWPQFDEVEAGWTFKPAVWGRGYATEAAAASVSWGFSHLGLGFVTAMIRADNAASIRVAERLGFTPRREDLLFGNPVTVWALDAQE
ncbi:GNAT family N-acetyltransferase [Streptomyces bathyalis]|uniref:GNAT family N-acetyltransferase n=1 Tax=Streptomyces bathyalis TaxID=2710756 RepID=A0A7T1WS87_9ACTN|nr:GNAT family N-acetyltransferase [Streptomyces bathyalis]QPP05470.1 GNAT family N-acetyltransferase [Streptomyces bathyalis]